MFEFNTPCLVPLYSSFTKNANKLSCQVSQAQVNKSCVLIFGDKLQETATVKIARNKVWKVNKETGRNNKKLLLKVNRQEKNEAQKTKIIIEKLLICNSNNPESAIQAHFL